MDFVLSEEQRMLADSLRRRVAESWTLQRRRRARDDASLDQDAWQALAELGVLGLTIDPEHDGFGEDPASLLPVHGELGRGLVGEPVIPSAVIAATVLARSGNAGARARWLPAIATGEDILTLAYLEPGRRYATRPALTRVTRAGTSASTASAASAASSASPADAAQATGKATRWVLNGEKSAVWHGGSATAWIVSAVNEHGVTQLWMVARNAAGVDVLDTPTMDGTRAARLRFIDVPLDDDALLAEGEAADAAIEAGLDWGIAALCAHAAGAMEKLLEITVDYLRTRKQFGQPLAAFQALQHDLADMAIAKELALSMAYVAVAALTEPEPEERRRRISSAKIEAARAGRRVGQLAIQLHGGMGMTDEFEVGDYFKRLTAVDMLLGDTAEHYRRLAQLELHA
jgi:alkylation response protein AidB-like acyl-CoA dehydrogenase